MLFVPLFSTLITIICSTHLPINYLSQARQFLWSQNAQHLSLASSHFGPWLVLLALEVRFARPPFHASSNGARIFSRTGPHSCVQVLRGRFVHS